MNLWEKIRLKDKTEASPLEENNDPINFNVSSVSRVEAMLRKKHSHQDFGRQSIERKVKQLSFQPRASAESNVLDYWERQKITEPEMHKLAQVVLSVPCTQVTAERAFSALGLILTDRRVNLSEKMLSNVLFVKLNSDLFDQVEIDYTKQNENQA